MMSVTADEALNACEAARHRVPFSPLKSDVIEKADTLPRIEVRFDVFLTDAGDVLNIGGTVIPGAPESVAALKHSGKRVLTVSNAASVGTDDLLKTYSALGFDVAQEGFVATCKTMPSNLNGDGDTVWGIVASASADLDDFGLGLADLLPDNPSPYETCDSVLLIGTGDWTEAQRTLHETACRRTKKPVIAGNPDNLAPRGSGFFVKHGQKARRRADVTDVNSVFYGKLFANNYDMAFARVGAVDRARVLMVGDVLHTDILGARVYGIASELVPEFGLFAGGNVEQAIEQTGITQDVLVGRPWPGYRV